MIIDIGYFHGGLLIPGLTGGNYASQATIDILNQFIEDYERAYLVELLGVTLAVALLDYVEAIDGETPPEENEALEEILSRLNDPDASVSPITGYVYYHYQRHNLTSSTMAGGEIQLQRENSVLVDSTDKMIRAWNSMSAESKTIFDWLIENQADYPDFDATRTFPLDKINSFNL